MIVVLLILGLIFSIGYTIGKIVARNTDLDPTNDIRV